MKAHIEDLIDNLEISPRLKEEFKAFNFKYYNNWADGKIKNTIFWKPSPEYLALDKKMRRKVNVPFSMFGFLLGSLSYVFRGLFLKGFIMLALVLLPDVLLHYMPNNASIMAIDEITGWFFIFYCAIMLRLDYFHKKCLNNKLIKPYILSKQVDFLTEKNSQPPEFKEKTWLKILIVAFSFLILFLAGVVYVMHPLIEDSIKGEIRILKLQPDERKYYRHIEKGLDFSFGDNYEKAIVEYSKAQEIYSGDYLVYGLKAGCYSSLKDYDNAILNIKKEIELYDKNPISIYYKIKYPAAKDTEALIPAKRPNMLFFLGRAYYNKGEYKEAIKYLTQAIELKDDGLYYHWRAEAKNKIGDKNGASKDYKIYEKFKKEAK